MVLCRRQQASQKESVNHNFLSVCGFDSPFGISGSEKLANALQDASDLPLMAARYRQHGRKPTFDTCP
jgi:hypothetical protein